MHLLTVTVITVTVIQPKKAQPIAVHATVNSAANPSPIGIGIRNIAAINAS